jgi:hypothetical protein
MHQQQKELKMEFKDFKKMARWSRDIIITEKLDGTNAQIYIGENGEFLVGSRTRYITPDDDNYGFAKWAYEHKDELMKLGAGRHFGEWWGQGIQRKYGMTEKRFSLFNTQRWCEFGEEPQVYPTSDPRITKTQEVLPECCHLVPVLYKGENKPFAIEEAIETLRTFGSVASPNFMDAEGVVMFHIASNQMFKKTIKKDEVPKGFKP